MCIYRVGVDVACSPNKLVLRRGLGGFNIYIEDLVAVSTADLAERQIKKKRFDKFKTHSAASARARGQ